MPGSWNLFRSDAGIELCREVCLLVAEHAIDEDPHAVKQLLLLSKVSKFEIQWPLINWHLQSFFSLLKSYEISCTKRLSYNDRRLEYTNQSQQTVLSSQVPPRDNALNVFSYAWYNELRFRCTIIEFLADHEITHMEDYSNDWPTLDVPKKELQRRLGMFKRRALLLLFQLVGKAWILPNQCPTAAEQWLMISR